MKIRELLGNIEVYTSNAEKQMLEQAKVSRPLKSFSERDQFTIEGLVRKSLVIKIGTDNPRVIANEN